MRFAIYVLLTVFTWLAPAWSQGFFDSFGSACSYQTLSEKKENCTLSASEKKNIENLLNIAKTNCLAKNNTPLCESIKEKFPFLSDQANSCAPSSLCTFPRTSNWQEALGACHRGEVRAANEFKADLAKMKESTEQMLSHFREEVGEIVSEQTRQLWSALKSCVLDKDSCSPQQMLSYLKSLPEDVQAQLVELVEATDSLECLEPQARIELLCYLRTSYGIELATSVAGGGAVVKGSKLFLGTLKKLSGLKKSTSLIKKSETESIGLTSTVAPVALVGQAKLENKFGGPVEFSVMRGKILHSPKTNPNGKTDHKEMNNDKVPPALLTVYSKSRVRLGDMRVTYQPTNKTLHIDSMYTEENFRKIGVGEALMERALKEFPETKIISVQELTQTNKAGVQKGLNKTKEKSKADTDFSNKNKLDSSNEQLKELTDAIKETPAYKIRSNLGFCEIIPDSINPKTFGFKVRCPTKD